MFSFIFFLLFPYRSFACIVWLLVYRILVYVNVYVSQYVFSRALSHWRPRESCVFTGLSEQGLCSPNSSHCLNSVPGGFTSSIYCCFLNTSKFRAQRSTGLYKNIFLYRKRRAKGTELTQAVFALRNLCASEFDRCGRNKKTWYTLHTCKILIYLKHKRVSIKNTVKNKFFFLGVRANFIYFRENLNLWSF